MKIPKKLRLIIIPLIFLICFVVFILTYNLLGLPARQELVEIARNYYLEYGYITIFIASLIEGLLVVNWYLPGSLVIVLGVILSAGDPLRAILMVSIITFAFLITSIINYLFGRFAWYRFLLFLGLKTPLEKMKQKVEKHGLILIFATYFHPNIGALTALSSGVLRLSFSRFLIYSIMALVLWNAFWGVVVYCVGPVLLNLLHMSFLIVVLACWVFFIMIRYFWRNLRLWKKSPKILDKILKMR